MVYNAGPKILGTLPPKIMGAKNMLNLGVFGQLQISIANISGTDRDIRNRSTLQPMAILSAFGEKSPVNFGPLTTVKTCEFGPIKIEFFGRPYFGSRGRCRRKFLHTLENDQGFLAHTPPGTGVPPTIFKNEHSKIGLNFGVRAPTTLGLWGATSPNFHT